MGLISFTNRTDCIVFIVCIILLEIICYVILRNFFKKDILKEKKCVSIKCKSIEILKYICVFCIAIIFIALTIVCALIFPPIYVLMIVVLVSMVLHDLLKNGKWFYRLIIFLIFVCTGTFVIFDNDISGPLVFSGYYNDNIINTSNFWAENYRYYWVAMIIYLTYLVAGALSISSLKLLKVIHGKYALGGISRVFGTFVVSLLMILLATVFDCLSVGVAILSLSSIAISLIVSFMIIRRRTKKLIEL